MRTRFNAFTLAEVLITLGIIGIVAAMTMPSLIANHKEKTAVAQLKKLNSLLSQAFLQIREEDGGGNLGYDTFNNSDVELMNRFGKYIKYQKTCPHNVGGCFKHIVYKNVKGDDYSDFSEASTGLTRSSAILADGTLVMFNIRSAGISDGKYAQIYADINGYKPPNKLGVDFFYWFLIDDRIFPGGVAECGKGKCSPNNFITGCAQDNGYDCTAWVIYNENMDYLHCPDKLGWDKASSCKK